MDESTRFLEQSVVAARAQLKRSADGPQPSARDWSAFFAALGQLLSVVLPMLLPLFVKDEVK